MAVVAFLFYAPLPRRIAPWPWALVSGPATFVYWAHGSSDPWQAIRWSLPGFLAFVLFAVFALSPRQPAWARWMFAGIAAVVWLLNGLFAIGFTT